MSGRQSPQAGEQKALPPVVVKKYANRRLYNTETSSYVTLDDLAGMVRDGRDFVVYDAKTGEDITRSVLTQIIVEQEGKGQNLLPTTVLRQLIGLYGDNLQSVVPRYLEAAMASFTQQQEQMRDALSKTMGGFMPFQAGVPDLQEVGKQNIAMMERAMSLFAPFARREENAPADETDALKKEIETLRGELAALKSRMRG
jgi:polyhydroxyalkanoate synthesis repressor PhaR